MSLRHQQQQKPLMMPVQKTIPETSGCIRGPQNTSDDEAQMAQMARQKIQVRLKVAKLFQQYRAQLVSNQYGVTVTSDPASVGEQICLSVNENKADIFSPMHKVVPLTVKNSGACTVYLTFVVFELVKNIFTVKDCDGNVIKMIKQHALGPGEAFKIEVHFFSDQAGFYEQLLVFKFETSSQSPDKFEIMRLLEVVHRTSLSEVVLPKPRYSLCNLQTMMQTPAEGFRLIWLKYVVPLKGYAMPDNIKNLRKSDTDLQKRSLNWRNYSWRFHLLLHLEELQQKTEIEKYKWHNMKMFRHKNNANLLILKVAGVSNNLSSLSRNQVLVTPSFSSPVFKNQIYKGWVHHVDAGQIYLNFNETFLSLFKDGMKFNVTFAIDRLPLRMQHRAAALVYKHRLKEVLFPSGRHSSHHSRLKRLAELNVNPEQQTAIQHIVAGSAKPAPYLVFGPPGTGKTVTLVEAINLIVKTQDSPTILACAPSNSATDHLCEKILEGKSDKCKLYRLYSSGFPVRNISKKLKFVCNLNRSTNRLMIPPKRELMKYNIMVTTLITAGRLVTGGIPPDHFTYIFVDEAGQATETECIIPAAGLLTLQKCQLVLAGDPKQLGPVITSRMAEKHGLGVSLLERLMTEIDLYKSHEIHGFNNRFITKLLRNYRSHHAILKIPNELFYKGELQPYADKKNCKLYYKWDRLPKKSFPLIFHGVAGTNQQDDNSPSVYNIAEVDVLKDYLKSLIDHLHKTGVKSIKPGEIGIISPYRKQVEKIQNAIQMDKDLSKKNLENILVGSVEQFQGREFNAILVSTVRSNAKLTASKQRFTLGFITNEKRFNVALTRARALLIVVGDPRVLRTDYIWNKFIHFCSKKGGYCGIVVSKTEEEDDALTTAHSLTCCEE